MKKRPTRFRNVFSLVLALGFLVLMATEPQRGTATALADWRIARTGAGHRVGLQPAFLVALAVGAVGFAAREHGGGVA